jgi:hypothetical protein
MAARLLSIETQAGNSYSTTGLQITPFYQLIRVRFPFLPAGLVWKRPVSVLVKDAAEREEVIKIPDLTRVMVWSLWGMWIVLPMFMWFLRKRVRKN